MWPKRGLPPSGVLAGSKTDPGGELPAVPELAAVAYRGDNSQCGGRADAANLHQALRRLRQACLGFDLPVVGKNALIEQAQLLEQIADEALGERGQALGGVLWPLDR